VNGADAKAGESRIRVIVADDNAVARRLLQSPLEAAGMDVTVVENGTAFLETIDATYDAAVLDLWMPDVDGIQCLQRMRQRGLDVPGIMVTAERAPERVVEAMKAGAFHYLTKPFPPDEVVLLVVRAAQARRLATENASLRAALQTAGSGSDWMAWSAAGRKVLAQVEKLADSDAPVLITGETGIGKSLLARMIHDRSPQAAKPFITVSCGAIPRDLLESELFGHERGAFTGALRDRPGRLELAADGTLFLDEIGELPLPMQPKVLRALQEREYERVGGGRTRRVGARVIAATNADIDDLRARGEFRRDLFYRIAVLRLHIPPLRDRPEDIGGLADLFLQRSARPGRPPFRLDDDARRRLAGHAWPGNARELQSVIERAVTFLEGPAIGAADLDFGAAIDTPPAPPQAAGAPDLTGLSIEEIERLAYSQALAAGGGNVAKAARQLGVSPKTVYNRLRALAIVRDGSPAGTA